MFEGTGWEAQERIFRQATGVYLDTSSLIFMEEYEVADKVWANLRLFSEQTKRKISVARSVVKELEKHMHKKGAPVARDRTRAANAGKAVRRLYQFKKEDWLDVKGDDGDYTKFADKEMLSKFIEISDKEQILLITQDRGLAQSVLSINKMTALGYRKDVNVRRITMNGNLSVFPFDPHLAVNSEKEGKNFSRFSNTPHQGQKNNFGSHQDNNVKKTTVQSQANEVYRLMEKPNSDPKLNTRLREKVELSSPIGEGARVYTHDGEAFTLEAMGKQGGEGTLYRLRPGNLVAKIYHTEKLKWRHYMKVKKMVDKPVHCEGICWPRKMLFSSYSARPDDFIGFAMEEASQKAKSLEETIFQWPVMENDPEFKKWNKESLICLSLTILEKIQFLHKRNVLLGDINGGNFLFSSPNKVYLVDTDSYQIDDLPCTVGKNEYVPKELVPKIRGKETPYTTFLRTLGNENYSIAVLLFRIMMMGQYPYSKKGSDNDFLDDAQEMLFPYPLAEHHSNSEPRGNWKYIWSHLSRDLKKAFFETFQRGEAHSTEHTRYNVKDWIDILEKYKFDLSHYMVKNDAVSLDLFPKDFKDVSQSKKLYENQHRTRKRESKYDKDKLYNEQGGSSAQYRQAQHPEMKEKDSHTIYYVIGTLIWLYIFYHIVA